MVVARVVNEIFTSHCLFYHYYTNISFYPLKVIVSYMDSSIGSFSKHAFAVHRAAMNEYLKSFMNNFMKNVF